MTTVRYVGFAQLHSDGIPRSLDVVGMINKTREVQVDNGVHKVAGNQVHEIAPIHHYFEGKNVVLTKDKRHSKLEKSVADKHTVVSSKIVLRTTGDFQILLASMGRGSSPSKDT